VLRGRVDVRSDAVRPLGARLRLDDLAVAVAEGVDSLLVADVLGRRGEPLEIRRAARGLALHHRAACRAALGRCRRDAHRLAARDSTTQVVGLALERVVVVDRDTVELGRRADPALHLLDHVSELVSDQLVAGRGPGLVLAGREMDFGSLRVRPRAQRHGVLGLLVHPHGAEAEAETVFHPGLHKTR
jgi:hypothetical protein